MARRFASPALAQREFPRAALVAVGLLGCAEPAPSPPADRLPSNRAELPVLACRDPVPSVGECVNRHECGSGQQCTLDLDAAPSDREPAPLRCGPPLGTGEARARCSDGLECQSGLCALAGVCLEPCAESTDCQRGQACQPVEVRIGEEALAPVQACARVAAFASDVRLSVETKRGFTRDALNRLPIDDLAQTNVLFLKADCARTLRVSRIVDRTSQRVLFDLGVLLDGVVQINPSINEGALLPLLLPNNPRLLLGSGGLDLGISVDRDTDLTLIRAARSKRGRILDLNVFYLGGGREIDETGLHPGSTELGEVMTRLAQRYAEIGIELGSLREYDVVGALRDELGVLSVTSGVDAEGARQDEVTNLGRLFELSAGVDDGGINIFVLQKMGPLLGISGGTPGALGLHGSPLSGVALALDSAGLARADQVLFHELAHQLGLLHTSEADGSEVEPLSDTLACSSDWDSDADGVLRSAECSEQGADNLMFWEGTGDALSAQQIELLARSPVLR